MPTANINIYDKRSLTNAVNKIKVLEPFLLNKFFKTKRQHSAETIDVEIIKSNANLAQFVSDGEGAKIIAKGKKDVKTVTIPRTYEKKIFTAKELADYQALIGNVYASPQERIRAANEMIVREVEDIKNRAVNRREELVCQILNTGKITISQDNIAFEIDFDFVTAALDSGGHIVTLAESYQWDDGVSKNIVEDCRKIKRAIMRRSGKNANVCILGEKAAEWFIADTGVKALLDNNNLRVGALDLTRANEKYGNYIGSFAGIEFYEYNQQYNLNGTLTDMISTNKAIFLPQEAAYDLHFGPVYRISANNQLDIITSEYLLEPKVDEDRTYLEWRLEQKSLPAISDPDTIVSMTVGPSA